MHYQPQEFLQLDGNANDLLIVNGNHTMKGTRLIKLDPNSTDFDEEIIDVAITSTNEYGEHPMFDKLLGKRIRVTVEILEEVYDGDTF